ncbi:TonB-dependent siderophore receptor [Erythrobacter sp. T5W1-R]|uniref:TonB-dependent siderophore receptor n=2 Tax=Erythrobacter sp. T5W1-R TaxID=3101752 RepID=UPI002AFF9773|nr:TonB-dependent siderophore receptor [Erythrobacter sp. T5W1-R]MEA1618041.1 TonB-dependent siderophore receptor [Erythrobacter sp. T5W1-R]
MNTFRATTSLLALVLAGGAILPAAAAAQSQDSSANSADDDSDGTRARRTAEEILVVGKRETGYKSETQSGGTFGEQSILDTPFSVTVITQELLIDQQVRSLGDIARNDPSTIVSTPPGFNDTINVRGYNLDNSSSYRREGLIFQNQVQSPFENKAAVEIIKGPTGVRYGFTPPGGVINYVLKRPTPTAYTFAQAFGDSYGGYGIHADVGGPIGDNLRVRLNAVAAREATFVDGVAGGRYLASALLEWKPADNLVIDFEFEYQFRELEQQSIISFGSFAAGVTPEQRRRVLENFDQTTFLGQDFGTYPTSNVIGSLGAKWEFAPGWTLQARAQQMRLERDQQGVGIRAGTLQANGDYTATIFFSPNQVRDPFSAEAFVTGEFRTLGITHEVAVGAAYSRNPLKFALTSATPILGTSNVFNPVTLPRPAPASLVTSPVVDALIISQEAVFVSDLVTVTEWLKLFGAVRHAEQRNQEQTLANPTLRTTYDDSATTPNVGILIQPNDKLTIYGSYAQGITTGVQIPITAINFGTQVFLDPARTSQYEIGVKAELFTGALLTAAYFDISQPLATFDERDFFDYIGDQNHRGFELTLSGELTPNLRVIAGGLYLDPTINNPDNPAVNGNRPSGVPRYQANLYADWKLPMVPGLAVNAGLFYTGDRVANDINTFTIDGYVRFDLGLRYAFEIGDQRLTARVNVRNVTDEDFIEGTAFGQFLFGSPRAAFFSLTTEF